MTGMCELLVLFDEVHRINLYSRRNRYQSIIHGFTDNFNADDEQVSIHKIFYYSL
jgi:hypothetical protein